MSQRTAGALRILMLLACGGGVPGTLSGTPVLTDPALGTLELVTLDPLQQSKLDLIDGLAFDAFGNLLGVLEILGAAGGVVSVDGVTGEVTRLLTGISRADQIALHPSGDVFVTSEVVPASTSNRVYRVVLGYDANDVPVAAGTTATSLVTSLAINDPEGIAVLPATGPYGDAGDLYVAEDTNPGRILHVDPTNGATTVLAGGLARPEGMAFGDFGGRLPAALYVAETLSHRVLHIGSDGTVGVVGDPSGVGLMSPDNLEFGPDGFLYVSEDRFGPASRIIRIAADGTHTVFATGFAQAQGMIFASNGDLYISEQDLDRIWRVRFATAVDARAFGDVKRLYR